MSKTPWGKAEELGSRRLAPGPSHSREAVASNQRERLLGATVAVVADLGYEATRVADIISVAGVSRSAFYKHFDNKQECFMATIDEIVRAVSQTIATTYDSHDGPWDDRLRAALDVFVALTVAQPAAARLCFVEVYAAGPEAIEHVEGIGDGFVSLAVDALRESPERAGAQRELVRAVVGGLRQIIHARLLHERQEELSELASDLFDWCLSYRAPVEPLRRPRKPPALPPSAPRPDAPRDRILNAVFEIAAEKGYRQMTITEIARRASVSLSTFYMLFDGKPDVFLAAIDDGERRMLEIALPAYHEAPDWPHAVKNGLHAFFAFMACNPATATLGGLDVFSGGTGALERHARSLQRFQALLSRGFEQHPDTSPIVGEAVAGAVAELLYQGIRDSNPGRLYELASAATFVALSPFVGPVEATAVANEGWRPSAG
ncbi:MAG TPA: TetR/AcrR family transcriptional regulator [Thermoleophilaceae bacterium]|nr:TetR/AcrR family transcriptional regulator [Thermoleophilaceae bacterium]